MNRKQNMIKQFVRKYLFLNSNNLTMQIRQTVKENNMLIKNVYHKHFNSTFKPEGLILTEMEINESGKIISVKIKKNDFDKVFESKIIESIKKWNFYNVQITHSLKVEVPFYFERKY